MTTGSLLGLATLNIVITSPLLLCVLQEPLWRKGTRKHTLILAEKKEGKERKDRKDGNDQLWSLPRRKGCDLSPQDCSSRQPACPKDGHPTSRPAQHAHGKSPGSRAGSRSKAMHKWYRLSHALQLDEWWEKI